MPKYCKLLFIICLGCISSMVKAELGLVKKQTHEIENFVTFYGEVIPHVRVGWESYGQLNADKSNVILITHYFTGNSHAAGKYHLDDEEAGYWDAIIGPGKAIDTHQYFVISVDSLVNISAYDENVITTGPASINPKTQQAYALDFPVVTMRDFVNVQKSVLDSLGIRRLHAVAGPSMGSMQAIEWALAYPDSVDRMISVIGSASTDGWTASLLDQWTWPIKLDPHWQEGNYYGTGKRPSQGLRYALALITQAALAPDFFIQTAEALGSNKPDMAKDIQQNPAMVDWLLSRAEARAAHMDANHLLYLVRANQLFIAGMEDNLAAGLAKMKAKSLFITAKSDLLLMPYHAELAHKLLKAQGKDTQLHYIDGPLGHLEGLAGIAKAGPLIEAFLKQ